MKKYKLTIPGLLPGLNEYIDAERSYKGKYKAASMKRQAQNVIGYMIRTQLRGVRFTRPVVIRYLWVEPSRRRDKDNIAFAKKFIQDALVETGVLRNDGWSEIEGFSDDFALDPKNPRVEVTNEEYEGGKQKQKLRTWPLGPTSTPAPWKWSSWNTSPTAEPFWPRRSRSGTAPSPSGHSPITAWSRNRPRITSPSLPFATT